MLTGGNHMLGGPVGDAFFLTLNIGAIPISLLKDLKEDAEYRLDKRYYNSLNKKSKIHEIDLDEAEVDQAAAEYITSSKYDSTPMTRFRNRENRHRVSVNVNIE